VSRINVYAENKGWLFEDLKKHFRNLGRIGQLEIIVTEKPNPSCDAWVCLRTTDGDAAPDLSRTAICIHDLFCESGMYDVAGSRRSVRDAGALVLCHPEQREILGREGVALDRRPMLERPLGALKIFSPGNELHQKFRIGWVGKNHLRKRLGWFLEAVTSIDLPSANFEVVLIGEGLGGAASILGTRGIGCRYFDRKDHEIDAYPSLYKELDCVVITSSTEAGPLPLFEALATGLVVVSTPVGWAPDLAKGFPRYVRLANSIDEIKVHLSRLAEERDSMFAERFAIARVVSQWSLDDWIREVIVLAGSLIVSSAESKTARLEFVG
jgi:glycosyltransferase involved in cell wall biosynthesis